VYVDGRAAKWIRKSLLAFAATPLLASCATPAALPAFLALLLIFETRDAARHLVTSRGISLAVQLLALAQLLGYVLAVKLPDLRRSGAALVVNGAHGTLSLPFAAIFFLCFLVLGPFP